MSAHAFVELNAEYGRELDPRLVGGKAATLGRLAAAGLPVPPGFVITQAAYEQGEEVAARLAEAAARLGPGPFAVRSSGAAEDLAEASYAGLYETYLNVDLGGLAAAVADCFASASGERVLIYREQHAGLDHGWGGPSETGMAVLVQQMVDADAAGVAFTANPVTGDRAETVVTATSGLGEGLVSGETAGEEWTTRNGQTVRTRAAQSGQAMLGREQAQAVAELAREIERLLEGPQDIEWAMASGQLYLLQARPMTALPEQAGWRSPGPGLWMRNFRLGEWLPDAITPLFATWLLPRIEAGVLDGLRETAGTAVPFRYAVVHGWYYNAPPRPTPRLLARALIESRGRLIPVLYNALIQVGRDPAAADQDLLAGLYRQWRDDLLPAYRNLIEAGEHRLDTTGPIDRTELIGLVDELGSMAGRYLYLLSIVGGSAWKMEACLATFCRKHLPGVLDPYDGVQVLLKGLAGAHLGPPPAHAVHSLDWYQPTAAGTDIGQNRDPSPTDKLVERHRQLAERRGQAEAACRSVLAGRPKHRVRFDRLVEVAQRYAVIREEQARDLSLAWPLLRRCARGLGGHLCSAGRIEHPDDVFFLEPSELGDLGNAGSLSAAVAVRRTAWQRQRRLTAPLTLGDPPRLIGDLIAKAVNQARGQHSVPTGAIVGHPASSGRATGRVRVLTTTADLGAFQDGEVLVTKATTPAWTPLFGRAEAVVTDGGSLAAHASLLAREYGIPAVVGTGDATTRLRTGQLVTVDGTAGTVTPADPDRDAAQAGH